MTGRAATLRALTSCLIISCLAVSACGLQPSVTTAPPPTTAGSSTSALALVDDAAAGLQSTESTDAIRDWKPIAGPAGYLRDSAVSTDAMALTVQNAEGQAVVFVSQDGVQTVVDDPGRGWTFLDATFVGDWLVDVYINEVIQQSRISRVTPDGPPLTIATWAGDRVHFPSIASVGSTLFYTSQQDAVQLTNAEHGGSACIIEVIVAPSGAEVNGSSLFCSEEGNLIRHLSASGSGLSFVQSRTNDGIFGTGCHELYWLPTDSSGAPVLVSGQACLFDGIATKQDDTYIAIWSEIEETNIFGGSETGEAQIQALLDDRLLDLGYGTANSLLYCGGEFYWIGATDGQTIQTWSPNTAVTTIYRSSDKQNLAASHQLACTSDGWLTFWRNSQAGDPELVVDARSPWLTED